MPDTKLLIAGLGRCGSSLIMQMLAAAGLRVPGEYPTHEHDADLLSDPKWLEQFDAVKWLGPGYMPAPPKPPQPFTYRVLWLDRDPKAQSKSRAKFLRAEGTLKPGQTHSFERKLRAKLHVEREESLRVVREYADPLVISFESLLSPEVHAGRTVSRWAKRDEAMPSDVDAMDACIRPRSPDCLPGFLESELAMERPQHA